MLNKTIGQVLNSIELERKRENVERIKSIIPALMEAEKAHEIENLRTQKTKEIEDEYARKLQYNKNLEDYQYEVWEKKQSKQLADEKDLINYRESKQRTSSSGSSGKSANSGVGWLDTVDNPKDYNKMAQDKVYTEIMTDKAGNKKQVSYVIMPVNGTLTRTPVLVDKGIYYWNNGNMVDLSQTVNVKDYNRIKEDDPSMVSDLVAGSDSRAKSTPSQKKQIFNVVSDNPPKESKTTKSASVSSKTSNTGVNNTRPATDPNTSKNPRSTSTNTNKKEQDKKKKTKLRGDFQQYSY